MKETEREKFAMVLAVLAEAFDRDVTKERAEIYWKFLNDLDIKALEYGARQIILTKKIPTFPTIAEMREAAGSAEDAEPAAIDAWSLLLRYAHLYDAKQRIKDPKAWEALTLAFGGLEDFLKLDTRSLTYERQYFIKCYKQIEQRARIAAAALPAPAARKLKE
jgi:hypothetical protein